MISGDLKKGEYFTILTTKHYRPVWREWKAIKESRKNSTYAFHLALGLVFDTKEECEAEIKRREGK